MNDPLNVVHKCEDQAVPAAVRAKLDAAYNAQRAKDIAEGNYVKKPDGYRLATADERTACKALAKRLGTAGMWTGKLEAKDYAFQVFEQGQPKTVQVPALENGEPKLGEDLAPLFESKPVIEIVKGWDAVVTFGHWWVREG